MKHSYVLHGWKLSYFSAKLRAYLRYKGIQHTENAVNAFDMRVRIPKHTGSVVMPVLETHKGEWLQDTHDIIRELERRHSSHQVIPSSSKQYLTALLLEAWADDFWLPAAMHYRWSFDKNYALFEAEAARNLLPIAPRFVSNKAVAKIAKRLRGFCPVLGVVPAQIPAIESWTESMFGHLDRHFSAQRFLLGDRPTIADFALCGPLYAHLFRDPAPKELLFDPHPNVKRWVLEVHGEDESYQRPACTELLPSDEISPTLLPVMHSVCSELLPMVTAAAERVTQFAQQPKSHVDDAVPRALEPVEFRLGKASFSRQAIPFSVWKMQGVVRAFNHLEEGEQETIEAYLLKNGGGLAALKLGPELRRHGLATRLA